MRGFVPSAGTGPLTFVVCSPSISVCAPRSILHLYSVFAEWACNRCDFHRTHWFLIEEGYRAESLCNRVAHEIQDSGFLREVIPATLFLWCETTKLREGVEILAVDVRLAKLSWFDYLQSSNLRKVPFVECGHLVSPFEGGRRHD